MTALGVGRQTRLDVGRIGLGSVDGWAGLIWPLAQLEEDTHRSTPPITGSIDATAVMASATMPPSHMAATA